MAASNYKLTTPHAAVIVWNYNDKGGLKDFTTSSVNDVEQTIISTLSCISITTEKAKSNPQGSFRLVLAPFKNWISTITPGSWCALLMSQNPIIPSDLTKADPNKVKMVGKIDSVRVDTAMGEDGARRTQYIVTGVDWGYIFNNTIYIDQNIDKAGEPATLGQGSAIAIQNMLFDKNGLSRTDTVPSLLRSLIGIFGQPIKGLTQQGKDNNQLANASYNFLIPQPMVSYFNFLDPSGNPSQSQKINDLLTLFAGSLSASDTNGNLSATGGAYNNKAESGGVIDPRSLQGQHSFWQILQDNSNPGINEMLCDLRWESGGPRFALYNRIRPFSFAGFNSNQSQFGGLKSYFQNVRTVSIDDVDVISVNAGTNWGDKYNFVEIKPQSQAFDVYAFWYKDLSQQWDPNAFSREGFRPLIVDTKQFPISLSQTSIDILTVDWNQIRSWVSLLKEWYFDTHRMLNGTMTIIGQNTYIGVGDNIQINADLISPTPNLTITSNKNNTNGYLLAHVENVQHSFTVNEEGARQFITTIQFVRGILVNSNGAPINGGTLDRYATNPLGLSPEQDRDTLNTVSTSDDTDPDPQKVRGT
jgi:hypothetical protein